MSTARRLVSRGRQHEESSPVPRNHHRRQDAEAPNEPTPLPPYEPPSCPLSASSRREIDNIRASHDSTKYKKHIKTAIKSITDAAADNNERLARHKTAVQRFAEQRRSKGIPDDQKPEHHKEEEEYANGMERQVTDLTIKAEKALRDLIDYGDELMMHDSIMRDVSDNLAAAPIDRPAARRRRQRSSGEDEEEPQEENAPATDENILSAVEFLKEAKEEYTRKYTSKSMRDRYADHNDYIGFKGAVHDAMHPGENQPPVPHASTWFPQDKSNESAGARRRRNNTTDNTNNTGEDEDDEDDDEIEMVGSSSNLKCPLSMQTFVEPYSNKVCSHTFEKSWFEEYFKDTATVFAQPGQPRGQRPQGAKQARCPQSGCDKMLRLEDFYIDQLILRKVQRMEKAAARVDEDDDSEEDAPPRGTQRNRPTQIDDDDESADEQAERRKTFTKIKRERQKSRGLSIARDASLEPDEAEVDAMDTN